MSNMPKNKPELLSPAGNFAKMRMAVLYGADSVYLAGNMFGMRSAADNFTTDEIFAAVDYAHRNNVKVYLAINTMPRSNEYTALHEYLAAIKDSGVDAVIAADLGVIEAVKKYLPHTELHLSTQSSVVSAATASAYHNLGINRIVLARELTLDEIKFIRDNTPPELELEVFAHGAMCVSYSGHCLLSAHFTDRDANRGMCSQPCRWDYKLYEVEEVKRPNERLPILETERGTFTFSSRDLCMAEHIKELAEAGVSSLKIEGRMKSAYYAAVTTNVYRIAIDDYAEGKPFNPLLLNELESVSHREYGTGFYFGEPGICGKSGYIREKAFLAAVDESGFFVQVNKLKAGDTVELVSPNKSGRRFTIPHDGLFDESGKAIESTPHPRMRFTINAPFEVKPGDILRGI
jgi:putative protease